MQPEKREEKDLLGREEFKEGELEEEEENEWEEVDEVNRGEIKGSLE